MDISDVTKDMLVKAILHANECLKSGEGIDLLYYLYPDCAEGREAVQVIQAVLQSENI